MSYINVLQTRIESLKARIKDETDDDRRISLYEDLELAKDDLRFEYAEQEAEEDYQRLKSEGWV
jgi:hypothetical protein